MKPKTVLVIGAAAAAIFGLLLVGAPAQMLGGFGLQVQSDGIVLSRDVGILLLGLAILNWLGRNATGEALRAILVANLVVQVLELAVNGAEIVVGQLPSAAVPGLFIHIVLGGIFALGLRKRSV
jgi:hypothetical protein